MKTKQRNVSFLPTQFVVVYLFIIYLLYIWQIYLKNLVWSFELTLSYLIYFYTFYNAIKRQHSSATFRNDFRLHSHFSKENIKHILFSECLKSFFFLMLKRLCVLSGCYFVVFLLWPLFYLPSCFYPYTVSFSLLLFSTDSFLTHSALMLTFGGASFVSFLLACFYSTFFFSPLSAAFLFPLASACLASLAFTGGYSSLG